MTAANYVWQIPYAVHQYGPRWDALTGLSIPLILTGIWFVVAIVLTTRGRRHGPVILAAFLVTEVAFYLVHNATGAFAADLPLNNPVVLIASVLGYASAATAVVYLVLMIRDRRSATAENDRRSGSAPLREQKREDQ